jgi:hypothetical protein
MTDAIIELSRRAVACKGWRWMPGMLTDSKFARVVAVDSDTGAPCATEEGASEDDCYAVWMDGVPVLPDLSDAATIGCLLALVREAWEQDDLGACRFDGRWCAEVTPQEGQHHAFYGDTEAEALVAALEAAP